MISPVFAGSGQIAGTATPRPPPAWSAPIGTRPCSDSDERGNRESYRGPGSMPIHSESSTNLDIGDLVGAVVVAACPIASPTIASSTPFPPRCHRNQRTPRTGRAIWGAGPAAPRPQQHHRVHVRGRPQLPVRDARRLRRLRSRRGDPAGTRRMASAHARAPLRRGACGLARRPQRGLSGEAHFCRETIGQRMRRE